MIWQHVIEVLIVSHKCTWTFSIRQVGVLFRSTSRRIRDKDSEDVEL